MHGVVVSGIVKLKAWITNVETTDTDPKIFPECVLASEVNDTCSKTTKWHGDIFHHLHQ
jgi:hypothetical protein